MHGLSLEVPILLALMSFLPFGIYDSLQTNEMSQVINYPEGDTPEKQQNEGVAMGTNLFTSRRRQLAYPAFTVVQKYGFTWVYYTDSYFWYNQYSILTLNEGSTALNEEKCLQLCMQDQPNILGYTCMSIDWWPVSQKCHLSEATSCNPTAGTYSHDANSEIRTQSTPGVANLYEKYCACTLSEVPGIPITFSKDYDTTQVDEIQYTQNQVFANTQVALCPILSCDIKQSDCSTPLDVNMAQYIKLESDYSLTISQTAPLGYQNYQVCMTCRNEIQVLSRQFIISQKMDCLIALQTQNFLPGSHVYNYMSTPSIKTFSYTDATKIFTNTNSGDCGAIQTCYLRAQGCKDPYTTGNVLIDPLTFALSAKQNINPGFEEFLCVVCENLAGGTTGILGDSWYVKQKMNCAIALQVTQQPLASQKHAYVDSTSKVISANTWQNFFVNNDPKGDCPNDSAVTCVLLNPGCNAPYTGSLTINPATGEIQSPQNVDAGYNDTVCIQCNSGVGGSVINYNNWNVEQTSNCAIATVNLISDSAEQYTFLYRDFDYKSSPSQVPYKKVNIDHLKSRWEIEKVHCLDQIQSFEFYASDNITLLSNNINETIIIPQSEISVTTAYFNRSSKIFLRNVKQYGYASCTQTLQLIFSVTGCDLIGIDFNKQLPNENPRREQYRFYNFDYPYLYQYNRSVSSDPNNYILYNMTETFVSEDDVNCPCVEYKIDQVKDSFFDIVLGQNGGYGFEFSINNTGFFRITNYTSYHKFSIWLSCTNSAGVWTGMRENNNILLEYEKPFEVPNLPPSFKGGRTEGVGFIHYGKDSEAGISGYGEIIYETIYNNRTNYTQPQYYPDRRHKVYTFPQVEDPEGESVQLKIITTLNESTTTLRIDNAGNTQLIFDKSQIPFDIALNISTDGRETYQETVWLSLSDSYGNVVYFFLTTIFIPPVEIPQGRLNFTGNFTKVIDCSDQILTANITSIDREALVNITYSQELYKAMFRISRIEDKLGKIPRWLQDNSSTDSNQSTKGQECYIWRKVPPNFMNLTDLNETQLEMYINPYNDRHLDDGFNVSKLNFTWQIMYFKWEYVLVQLKFEAPNYISTEEVWDQFFFRVKQPYSNLFYSEKINAEIHRDYWNLTHSVKPQVDQDWFYSRWIIWMAQLIKIFLQVIFWGCVLANVFWGGSMRWYFTLIRTLQIVLHLPMVRIVVPTCVIYAYSIIIPIVKWDIFEGTPIKLSNWLPIESNEFQVYGIYQQMQLLGYTSNQTLDNLDSITIFFIVYILKLVFLGFLKAIRIQYGKGNFWQKTYVSLKKSLFFCEFFMIIIEPYIEYLIAGYMQFGYDFQKPEVPKAIESTSTFISKQIFQSGTPFGEKRFLQPNYYDLYTPDQFMKTTNEAISIILLITCLGIMPLLFIYLLMNNINMYQMHKFQSRYGNLFEDIELRSKWQAAFYFVFIIRRVIIVSIIFSIEHFSAIQLLFINLSNLAMLIYVGYNNSLIGKWANRLEAFNELCVCFISFHMYFFTDWVLDKNNQTDKDLQYTYGIMMNCFITYYIYVNLWIILHHTLKTYWHLLIKYGRVIRFLYCEWGLDQEIYDTLPKPENDHVKQMMFRFRKYRSKKLYEPEFYQLVEDQNPIAKKKMPNPIKTEMNVILEESKSISLSKDELPNPFEIQTKSPIAVQALDDRHHFAAFMDSLPADQDSKNPFFGQETQDKDTFNKIVEEYSAGMPFKDSLKFQVLDRAVFVKDESTKKKVLNFAAYMDAMDEKSTDLINLENQKTIMELSDKVLEIEKEFESILLEKVEIKDNEISLAIFPALDVEASKKDQQIITRSNFYKRQASLKDQEKFHNSSSQGVSDHADQFEKSISLPGNNQKEKQYKLDKKQKDTKEVQIKQNNVKTKKDGLNFGDFMDNFSDFDDQAEEKQFSHTSSNAYFQPQDITQENVKLNDGKVKQEKPKTKFGSFLDKMTEEPDQYQK